MAEKVLKSSPKAKQKPFTGMSLRLRVYSSEPVPEHSLDQLLSAVVHSFGLLA
jgi:hypothetical protein